VRLEYTKLFVSLKLNQREEFILAQFQWSWCQWCLLPLILISRTLNINLLVQAVQAVKRLIKLNRLAERLIFQQVCKYLFNKNVLNRPIKNEQLKYWSKKYLKFSTVKLMSSNNRKENRKSPPWIGVKRYALIIIHRTALLITVQG